MTFGLESTDAATSSVRVRGVDNIKPFLEMFKSRGHHEVDTARVYCGGDTETVLSLLAAVITFGFSLTLTKSVLANRDYILFASGS